MQGLRSKGEVVVPIDLDIGKKKRVMTNSDEEESTPSMEKLGEDMQEMRKNMKMMMEMMKGMVPPSKDQDNQHQIIEEEGSNSHSNAKIDVETPFKLQANFQIPSYVGELDPEKLDGWLKTLEVYFSTKAYTELHKVSFARLKLGGHALTWWEAHTSGLSTNNEPPVSSWIQFSTALRNQFYPIGHRERLKERWQFLRQTTGQTVQEYTTEFRKQAVALGVNLRNPEVLDKYRAGLFFHLRTELALFGVTYIDGACKKAMYIEMKSRSSGNKTEFSKKSSNQENGFRKGDTKKNHVVANKGRTYCDHCKTDRHSKEKCWKLHPDLQPSWWKDKGKKVANVCIEDEVIEGSSQPNEKLACMAGKMGAVFEETKEELFWVYAQIGMTSVITLFDSGSQQNLISEQLVKELKLSTFPHPQPYPLGWLQKDVELQVKTQCKFKFAINEKFKDEITCDVVPLDVCQIIFGSPYLWDRDGVFYRRENVWRLVKDGKGFRILASKEKKKLQLITAQQTKHLVNVSRKFVLVILRPLVEDSVQEQTGALGDCSGGKREELERVISNFKEITEEPKGLPPKREIEHEIQLLLEAPVPNVGL